MTQDEIIEMARQVGLLVIGASNGGEAVYTWPAGITEEIQAFAKLVAEKEREACAEICENYGDEAFVDGRINADHHAYLIRARGQA